MPSVAELSEAEGLSDGKERGVLGLVLLAHSGLISMPSLALPTLTPGPSPSRPRERGRGMSDGKERGVFGLGTPELGGEGGLQVSVEKEGVVAEGDIEEVILAL